MTEQYDAVAEWNAVYGAGPASTEQRKIFPNAFFVDVWAEFY